MGLIRRATDVRVKIKALLGGPSSSGKTYVSLMAGRRFLDHLAEAGKPAGNNRILVIDSQKGQSAYYNYLMDFDIIDLYRTTPEAYLEAFDEAAKHNYGLTIVDSISHEWAGKDGLLEVKDAAIRNRDVKNDFAAFGLITPRHEAFKEGIQNFPGHMIATVRAKTEYVLNNEGGKSVPKKVGLGHIQRDNIEYEFDIKAMIEQDHSATFEARGKITEAIGDRRLSPEEMTTILPRAMADFILGQSFSPDIVTGDEIVALKGLAAKLQTIDPTAKVNWDRLLTSEKVKSWEQINRKAYDSLFAKMTAAVAARESMKAEEVSEKS